MVKKAAFEWFIFLIHRVERVIKVWLYTRSKGLPLHMLGKGRTWMTKLWDDSCDSKKAGQPRARDQWKSSPLTSRFTSLAEASLSLGRPTCWNSLYIKTWYEKNKMDFLPINDCKLFHKDCLLTGNVSINQLAFLRSLNFKKYSN